MAAFSPTAKWCKLCRVHPGAVDVKGFSVCHRCLGKSVHAIGAVANHAFNPGVCPPFTHCTGADISASSPTAGSQSAITLGMGLFLLAAAAGTLWLYSQSGSQGKGVKFGFGLQKSR